MSDQKTDLKILIISGRSGSGKSSTSYEICHLLKSQKIPHVHIDGDNLDALYPRDDSPEVMLANLKLLWTTYWTHFDDLRKRDHRKQSFVVVLDGTAMVLNMERIVRVFTDVVHGMASSREGSDSVNIYTAPIVLEASDEVAERRLTLREIGGELTEHLESSTRMSRMLGQAGDGNTRRFVNDTITITDLARKILEHIGIEA